MILEQLGKLVDAEGLTNSDTYVGYCIDLVSAITEWSVSDVWVVLSANVAADYTTGNETYEFQLRGGTGVDGSDDINAGVVVIESTSALNGDDERLDVAGDYIWRHTLDYYASKFQYLQLYYAQTGTTPTITVDFSLSPSKPPSDRNMQVELSPVGVP